MPAIFMHGEYDWVTRESADKLIDEGKVKGEVFTVSNSGHHLYIENAAECVSDILNFTHGENVSN